MGMSQRDLATKAGCTQSYLAKVERERTKPSYALAGKIFEVLEAEEHRDEAIVGDIMHFPVTSLDVNQTVADATKAAKSSGVDQFPIQRRGHLVGCVTTTQLIGVDPGTPLRHVMSDGLPTVPPSTAVGVVRSLLHSVPAVIVVEDGEIRGIVSAHDLL